MTIDEAIKILSKSDKTNLGITYKELQDAEKLGLEALKCVVNQRKGVYLDFGIKLPGETKD